MPILVLSLVCIALLQSLGVPFWITGLFAPVQGDSRARDVNELIQQIGALLDGGLFGNLAIVEQYLPGEELTVTVMPDPADANATARRPLVLPQYGASITKVASRHTTVPSPSPPTVPP